MLMHKTFIRVRYNDTDKMQVVHNSNYIRYFEIARTELLRDAGMPYKDIEHRGFHLPVVETWIKYKYSAYYDDILEVQTFMKELPKPIVYIEYKIKRAETTRRATKDAGFACQPHRIYAVRSRTDSCSRT